MIRKRIIPQLLLKDGRMVKGSCFDDFRDVGNPVTTARIYNAQKADELMFLDIMPTTSSRESVHEIIRAVAGECFMPLTVGGGIRTVDEVAYLLSVGADKVAVNTAAVEDTDIIRKIAQAYGNQCVVLSVDYKITSEGRRIVYTHSGKMDTGLDALSHIKNCIKAGAGELLLTSIANEGMMRGYDLEFIDEISREVDIPLIASGGAGTLQDFEKVLMQTDAAAVAAGSIFHFTDQSPIKARFFLYNAGITVRID